LLARCGKEVKRKKVKRGEESEEIKVKSEEWTLISVNELA
jgi:hypothetical protein